MSDAPRRPILSLKKPLAPKPAPEPEPTSVKLGSPRYAKPFRPRPAEPAPPPPSYAWKCRPCGTGFNVSPELTDEESVRCPSCNARLGKAVDFRAEPPNVEKLRARPATKR